MKGTAILRNVNACPGVGLKLFRVVPGDRVSTIPVGDVLQLSFLPSPSRRCRVDWYLYLVLVEFNWSATRILDTWNFESRFWHWISVDASSLFPKRNFLPINQLQGLSRWWWTAKRGTATEVLWMWVITRNSEFWTRIFAHRTEISGVRSQNSNLGCQNS